jgi:RNase P/RNase MRP subunit POP5
MPHAVRLTGTIGEAALADGSKGSPTWAAAFRRLTQYGMSLQNKGLLSCHRTDMDRPFQRL